MVVGCNKGDSAVAFLRMLTGDARYGDIPWCEVTSAASCGEDCNQEINEYTSYFYGQDCNAQIHKHYIRKGEYC